MGGELIKNPPGGVRVIKSTCRSGSLIPTGEGGGQFAKSQKQGLQSYLEDLKRQDIDLVGLVSKRDTQISYQNGCFTWKMQWFCRFVI